MFRGGWWRHGLAGAVVLVMANLVVWVMHKPVETTWRRSADPIADHLLSEPATLAPLAFDSNPVWGYATKGAPADVDAVRVADDLMVLTVGNNDIHVVEATTGAPVWELADLRMLPGGDGAKLWGEVPPVFGGGSILVAYVLSACSNLCLERTDARLPEFGIAALEPRTGAVRWKTATITGGPADRELSQERMRAVGLLAEGSVAVLGGATNLYSGVRRRDQFLMVGVDIASGRKLWQMDGVVPQQISRKTVIGTRVAGTVGSEGGSLVAVDATSGATRWDTEGRYAQVTVQAVVGDLALIATGGFRRMVLLSMRSGTELDAVDAAGSNCATDGQSLIACGVEIRGNSASLLTVTAGQSRISVSVKALKSVYVAAVWQGRILGNIRLNAADIQLDRAGNVLGEAPVGLPIVITQRYLVNRVALPNNQRGYQVHRLRA